MRILVIGGTGYIGNRLVEDLVGKGVDVTVVSRKAIIPKSTSDVRYIQSSLEDLSVRLDDLGFFDIVYHLAWTSVPSSPYSSLVSDHNSNVIGSLRLFKAMHKAGVGKIVFMSTGGAIYGNHASDLSMRESDAAFPISTYGISKLAVEGYLRFFDRQGFLDPIIVRPSNIYGPGQRVDGIQGVIGRFLFQIMNRKDVHIFGTGGAVRDYLYIDDLITFLSLITTDFKKGTYNVSSGQGTSINKLVELIGNIVNLPVRRVFCPKRSTDVDSIILDNSFARKSYNWQPIVSLEEGICLQYEWLKSNINQL